jgi:hypothetical protein
MAGWIAVDLDGTLADWSGWRADGSIGDPIPAMVNRVKRWLREGKDVRIFTARVWPYGTTMSAESARVMGVAGQLAAIRHWCREHLGEVLPITCIKDPDMIELWDDRAVTVKRNLGTPVDPMMENH